MPLYIPDTNEFHPMEDFQGPIIVRAAYNGSADRAFITGDANKAMRQPWKAAYQYLSAGADPVASARAFKQIIGTLKFDATFLDLEEGDGDQRGRQHAWLNEMATDFIADGTYSGLYFARTHNVDTGGIFWIAAYGQGQPTTSHSLWQFSDAYTFPGIQRPCDASIFNGTLADLLALTHSAQPTSEADMAAILLRIPDGRVFAQPRDGGRPWHVAGDAALAVGQYIGVLEGKINDITDPAQAAQIALSVTGPAPTGGGGGGAPAALKVTLTGSAVPA